MPKRVASSPGKRVQLYLRTDKQIKIAGQIDNLSAFFQLALEDAAGIMAMAILRKHDAEKYRRTKKIEDVVDGFNEEFPLDELTAKRTGKWPKNSAKKQEMW